MQQSEAASRAGISQATASLIENGSASVSIGQVVRYLDAIASGKTLASLLTVDDPVVLAMEHESPPKRARRSTPLIEKQKRRIKKDSKPPLNS